MSRRDDLTRDIARAEALGTPAEPWVEEWRNRLLDELDKLSDERFDAQRALHRSDAGRGRLGAKLLRYDLPGVDEASYRRLVGEAWIVWRVAMDDWELRHGPGKPARRLEDNWRADDIAYDYGADTGVGLEDWAAWYRAAYQAPRGRRWPGGIPCPPLYGVFFLAREWWFQHTDKRTFGLNYDGADFTAAERFFLGIAQIMDPGYTAKDCATVYENCRR